VRSAVAVLNTWSYQHKSRQNRPRWALASNAMTMLLPSSSAPHPSPYLLLIGADWRLGAEACLPFHPPVETHSINHSDLLDVKVVLGDWSVRLIID
jgi:hypothetical protein